MIDLEALALERARRFGQLEADWQKSITRPFFEVACTGLSDGEIMQLFASCDSPVVLEALFEGFASACESGEEMAYKRWKDHLDAQGLSMSEGARLWQRLWDRQKGFSFCLKSIQTIKASKSSSKRKRA